MCCFTDEQWNNLKAILIDHRDGLTDDQWKTDFHLPSENRLNDEQFGMFVDMLDTLIQKLVLLHAGGGTGKTFVSCNFLKSYPCAMKFVVTYVQPGLVQCTYHKGKLSTLFSGHGAQV